MDDVSKILLFSVIDHSGKNISETLGYHLLPHFDVICDLLLNRRMATCNLFVNLMYTV